MVTPENLRSRDPQSFNEVDSYPPLDVGVEPFDIADQAITNLQGPGSLDYAEVIGADSQPLQPEEVIVNPTESVEKPLPQPRPHSNITNLDEYRKTRQKRLDNAEQIRLVGKAKQGDESALQRLWLDAQVAADYVSGVSKSDWPKEDKVQTCLEVVPGAVSRYDTSKGASFRTYLVRRMVGALLDEERAYGRANGVSRRDYQKLQAALKSEDPEAAIHALTQPEKTETGSVKAGFAFAPNLVKGSDIITTHSSLEELMYGSPDSEGFGTAAEPEDSQDVFEEAVKGIDAARLHEIIQGLPERERIVVTYYYGLFGTPQMYLREIGEQLGGLTEGRISQIHVQAMERITLLWQHKYGLPVDESEQA